MDKDLLKSIDQSLKEIAYILKIKTEFHTQSEINLSNVVTNKQTNKGVKNGATKHKTKKTTQ